ncbi:hypothetical protein BCR34DRAFT_665110 [Clohesyomyces aquaticus]|uniref:NDT80 domain-containing protein n=1 Tax=Clohesyomyces aquaticus TaxID=1231657 RepID=A0A1Y1ZIV1_9PLEO|nr:hypothetical protein BCR34DRAFT_665110 [Clohesyomyces aquaticus]
MFPTTLASNDSSATFNDITRLPFGKREDVVQIVRRGGPVNPNINVKADKGFFVSGPSGSWTMYARSELSIGVAYSLHPHHLIEDLKLSCSVTNRPLEIQSFAISLSARPEVTNGYRIELVQNAHNRSRGRHALGKVNLSPMPEGKVLDTTLHTSYGDDPDPFLYCTLRRKTGMRNHPYQHVFERVFLSSVSPKGTPPPSHRLSVRLVVDLWAYTESGDSSAFERTKVATRSSHPVTVIGKIPALLSKNSCRSDGALSGTTRPLRGVSKPGRPRYGETRRTAPSITKVTGSDNSRNLNRFLDICRVGLARESLNGVLPHFEEEHLAKMMEIIEKSWDSFELETEKYLSSLPKY